MEKSVAKDKKKVSSPFKQKWNAMIVSTFQKNSVLALVLCFCFLATHIFEIFSNKIIFVPEVIYFSFLNDIYAALFVSFIIIPASLILALIANKVMSYVTSFLYFSLILIHLLLSIYFFKSKVLMGSDLFSYSPKVILSTIKSSLEFDYLLIIFFFLSLMIIGFFAYYINHISKSTFLFSKKIIIISLVLLVFLTSFLLRKDKIDKFSPLENYVSINKSWFFFNAVFEKYTDKKENTLTEDTINNPVSVADSTQKTNSDSILLETNVIVNKNTQILEKEKKSVIDQAEIKKSKAESEKLKTSITTQPISEGSKIALHTLKSSDFADEKGKPVSKGFYVVVATFGNIKNAGRFKAEAIHKGHSNTKMILNKISKLYNIFLSTTNNLDEGEAAKYRVEYPGVWILKLE